MIDRKWFLTLALVLSGTPLWAEIFDIRLLGGAPPYETEFRLKGYDAAILLGGTAANPRIRLRLGGDIFEGIENRYYLDGGKSSLYTHFATKDLKRIRELQDKHSLTETYSGPLWDDPSGEKFFLKTPGNPPVSFMLAYFPHPLTFNGRAGEAKPPAAAPKPVIPPRAPEAPGTKFEDL